MTREQYAVYEKTVAEFIAHEQLSFLSTGTDVIPEDEGGNPDTWFSGSPCDCCHSPLGGTREYLFARSGNESILVTFEICMDCVYYLNYGKLDDMTMLEMERTK